MLKKGKKISGTSWLLSKTCMILLRRNEEIQDCFWKEEEHPIYEWKLAREWFCLPKRARRIEVFSTIFSLSLLAFCPLFQKLSIPCEFNFLKIVKTALMRLASIQINLICVKIMSKFYNYSPSAHYDWYVFNLPRTMFCVISEFFVCPGIYASKIENLP